MASEAGTAPALTPATAPNEDTNTATASPPVTDDAKPADSKHREPATNDKPPSVENCRKVENYTVLDRKGDAHPFKSIYEGSDSTPRVLVIFIRHFFCGSCQEFIRALSESVRPDDLLRLPVRTSIAVIGCGDPGLIDHYVTETGCQFPIYADPSRKLYKDLGMITSMAMGSRPEYFRKSMMRLIAGSFAQGLRHISSGLVNKAGDSSQNGGEFLYEPSGEGEGDGKLVTWCHRMANTRDHTGISELVRVLDPQGKVLPSKS